MQMVESQLLMIRQIWKFKLIVLVEKTWLKHYDPRVSAEIDADRYDSVVDIFEQSVKKFKDKEAFINMGQAMTFGELDTLSAQFAAYLQASGLQRGDAVAIMMPNLLQYPVAMFGIFNQT